MAKDYVKERLFELYPRSKRTMEDIYELLSEDSDMADVITLSQRHGGFLNSQTFIVSADRGTRKHFNYYYFDKVLNILNWICINRPVFRPTLQIRVVKWGGTSTLLRDMIILIMGSQYNSPVKNLLVTPISDQVQSAAKTSPNVHGAYKDYFRNIDVI